MVYNQWVFGADARSNSTCLMPEETAEITDENAISVGGAAFTRLVSCP